MSFISHDGRPRREILKFLALNVFIAFSLGWLKYSHTEQGTWSDFSREALVAFIFSSTISGLTLCTMPALSRRISHRSKCQRLWIYWISLQLLTILGCTISVCLIQWAELLPGVRFSVLWTHSVQISFLITACVVAIFSAFAGLRSQLEQTRLELRTKELEHERALQLATQAQLASLESRVHPHFLFNTLNSISALVREDPGQAERLIERMSALLRFSLDSAQTSLTNLRNEMKIVRDYLEIERVRFGERLRYAIDVSPECESIDVPTLSVQTLVENSVKYVVSPRREGGEIRIAAYLEEGRLRIEVWDDGPGFCLESTPSGHGIDNLQRRLQTLFQSEAELRVSVPEAPSSNQGASVILVLPNTKAVSTAESEFTEAAL